MWMSMYCHTLACSQFIGPLRICDGDGASEFGNSFRWMGVLGVPQRRISHASHGLLVEFAFFTITSNDDRDTLLP